MKVKNQLVAISGNGSTKVYLNVKKDDAVKRYEKETGIKVIGDMVTEISVYDEFNTYEIWV